MKKENMRPLILLLLFFIPLLADEIYPYLQTPTPNSVIINWETSTDTETSLRFGQETLSQTLTGSSEVLPNGHYWHTVHLANLLPDTPYKYQIKTILSETEVFTFSTFPQKGAKTGHIRMIVRSDPQTYYVRGTEIVNAMTRQLEEMYGENWRPEIDLVFTDGDIVGEGWDLSAYQREYFGPIQPLTMSIPGMTAIGNHEAESDYYYQYMKFDDFAGPEGEAYYTFPMGTVQMVVLNSNWQWRNDAQIEWLDETLAEAENNPDIDWVFTFCHHPGKSSIWTPGNTGYVEDRVIPVLHKYSKAEFLINGHTHAYERGQTVDGRLRLMIAGGAAGNLDRWADNLWADYPEHQFNFDQHHWVLFDFDLAGQSYSFSSYSTGHPEKPLDNLIIDSLTVFKNNDNAPAQPQPFGSADSVDLPYEINGGEYLGETEILSTQFQLSSVSGDYQHPAVDRLRYPVHYFLDSGAPDYLPQDQSAGVDITRLTLTQNDLALPGEYYWRVRYRDARLNWSDWSAEQKIVIRSTGYNLPQAANKSYIFDGKNSHFSITEDLSSAVLPVRAMTVETWVKLKSNHTWGGYIGAVEDNGGYEKGWVLGNYGTSFSFGLATTGANDGDGFMTYLSAPSSFGFDQWYHVAVTFNGADMKLYINGKLSATSTKQWGDILYDTQSYFDIGVYHDDNEFNVLDGELDEIRLWSTALSLETIQDWMHQEINSGHPEYAQLISYWNLDGLNADRYPDQKGSNDAYLQNAALTGYVASDVPLGHQALFMDEHRPYTLGQTDAALMVTPLTSINTSNYLGLYLNGTEDQPPVEDQTLPADLTKRSNLYWGIREYGSCKADLKFSYAAISGLPAADSLHLIFRENARSNWKDLTGQAVNDPSGAFFLLPAQTSLGEYALGWGSAVSAIEKDSPGQPAEFLVENNYPNPFNHSTTFQFVLPAAGEVNIDIFNSAGQRVWSGHISIARSGINKFIWDGTDNNKNILPSGVYFAALSSGSQRQFKKIMMIK